MGSIVEIGGRRFERITDWTVEQDWWLMQRIGSAGLDTIQVPAGVAEDVAQVVADEMSAKLADAGCAVELLGGLLVPEGTSQDDWTPALAEETADFLKRQRGHEARVAVRNLAVWAVVLFFGNGLVSFKISPTSSTGEPVATEEAPDPSGEEAEA